MERSRPARHAAERALALLALALGDEARRLIVIGGLNADLLTVPQEPPHQGTTDIDAFIELPVIYDRDEEDYGWLEHGLTAAGFVEHAGWRWSTQVDGYTVVLDLLTDVDDNPGQPIALPGTTITAAQNLPGPRAVRRDTVPRRLSVVDRSGTGRDVTLRFVGLGGYLLAKAAALLGRDAAKDAYDLAFVLLHNVDGGPGPAGKAVAAVADPDQGRLFLSALQKFDDVASSAPQHYAAQRIHDGVDLDADILAQDAVTAAVECRRAYLAEKGESA